MGRSIAALNAEGQASVRAKHGIAEFTAEYPVIYQASAWGLSRQTPTYRGAGPLSQPFHYRGARLSPATERGGRSVKPTRGGPILVVEDDPEILSTVADILEFEGYQVECATNGEEALEAVERARPRLVILDMRMPVLDGWDFARILKERGLALPILVMTAAQDAQRWAAEIDAKGFIPKPFDIPDLITAIERVDDFRK